MALSYQSSVVGRKWPYVLNYGKGSKLEKLVQLEYPSMSAIRLGLDEANIGGCGFEVVILLII